MKVEIIKPVAGLSYFEGDVVDLAPDRAKDLIVLGFCIPVKDSTQIETAEAPDVQQAENASIKTPKGKGKR